MPGARLSRVLRSLCLFSDGGLFEKNAFGWVSFLLAHPKPSLVFSFLLFERKNNRVGRRFLVVVVEIFERVGCMNRRGVNLLFFFFAGVAGVVSFFCRFEKGGEVCE